MHITTTRTHWSCLALAACTLITACSTAPAPAIQVDNTCFTHCDQERTRCNALCSAANEECSSNAKYLAQLRFSRQKKSRDSDLKTIQQLTDMTPCKTHCGCIPSRKTCFTLCHGKI